MENKNNIIIFSIALLLSAIILAFSIKNIVSTDGVVTVKGSSQQYVVADKVLWNISFVSVGNDLDIINNKIITDTDKVKKFLKKYALTDEEISLGQLDFVDLDAREYNTTKAPNRFIVTQTIVIESNNVNAVEKASKNLLDLLQENVYLKENYNETKPMYIFTKLDDIKNTMIEEAIKKAESSAREFADNSNVKLGKIKKANQGMFVITGKNKGDYNELYQKEKEVRVVSTFEYYLK